MSNSSPKLVREPITHARSVYFDSRRWEGYQPRSDDIIISTYPKCGTTWMQRIVGMLIFQSADPFPVQESSPWPDFGLPPPGAMLELAESQTHRRFIKSHLPYDTLPVYEGVKFIHVARDGRDAAMSFHNHKRNYTDATLDGINAGIADDPRFPDSYERPGPDPADHFHAWVEGPADEIGDEKCGYFYLENSFWAARHDPNVLLVHYADMKQDLDGEMRRIAQFLGVEVSENLWPELVKAATFGEMKKKASELMPTAGEIWEGGGNTFLNKGENARWKSVFHEADLDAYDAKVAAQFSPSLANWSSEGRLVSGDPRELPD